MKIALYSPYLDTYGGGEKYMMTIAEVLSEEHDVNVLLDAHLVSLGSDKISRTLSERFNLKMDKVKFIRAPIGKNSIFFQRLIFLKKYDLLFYLTDGSIFYPSAKKNILHIQSPIKGQPSQSLWGGFKLKGWGLIIYNSNFTRENSQKNWPISSKVIYPPIDTDQIKPLQKKKYILSVGRFFGFLKDKKHESLIKAFKDLYKNKQLAQWSLYLVGSASDGDLPYIQQLQKMAKGLPIKFYPNLDYKNLITLYGESSIYWHAAGYGEKDPNKMEHFGISTVEAMAGGCIPIVINRGGQPEIIENKENGYLWDQIDQLKQYTIDIIKDGEKRKKISKKAIERSKIFSKNKFKEEILKVCKI